MGSHKKLSVGGVIGNVFGNIFRIILALIMVGIITGCIVASVLTVYILRYANSDEQIRLEDAQMRYTTILYANDPATNEPVELQELQTLEYRIYVPYDQIPQYMKDAAVAIEDKRFWEHHGVDWKRTFGAFVNMFIPIYPTQAGGSTITQQVIKNITGEDEVRVDRKVREIFRALKLEQNYTKEQILETYLNTIFFSNQSYGVQAAANTYFGKDVQELTLAECASIIGITNAPTAYNPLLYPENNKKRQEDILYAMWEQGKITDQEYEEAINEELVFQKDIAVQRVSPVYSYFVDHVIEEVISDLQDEYGYTYERAQQMVNSGGLRIYTTVDQSAQNWVQQYYSDAANFPQTILNEEYPQSAFVLLDTNGAIKALAGAIGEKKGMREFSRATQAYRQTGSSIKPIAAYLQAVENDIVTWSTKLEDSPIELDGKSWPVNHYGRYLGPITIDEAIQRSTNTIPVKLVQIVTPKRVFDFLKEKLGMESLIERTVVNGQVFTDNALFPMALGGLTEGVTPLELAGAYQIYANGGYFTKPYAYTTVKDYNGNVILEKDTTPRRVISPETATIVNKLMQRVTSGPYGTGTTARFQSIATTVAGKTGTTDDDKDQWFAGVTPYYVGVVWMGFDEPERIRYTNYAPPIVFRQVMEPLHQNLPVKQFEVWGNVVEKTYCTESGDLAIDTCPSTAVGWYKESNIPSECFEHSGQMSVELDDEDLDDEDDVRDRKEFISESGLKVIESDD